MAGKKENKKHGARKHKEESPKGTMTLLILFLALTLAGWFGVYMLLVNRGG